VEEKRKEDRRIGEESKNIAVGESMRDHDFVKLKRTRRVLQRRFRSSKRSKSTVRESAITSFRRREKRRINQFNALSGVPLDFHNSPIVDKRRNDVDESHEKLPSVRTLEKSDCDRKSTGFGADPQPIFERSHVMVEKLVVASTMWFPMKPLNRSK